MRKFTQTQLVLQDFPHTNYSLVLPTFSDSIIAIAHENVLLDRSIYGIRTTLLAYHDHSVMEWSTWLEMRWGKHDLPSLLKDYKI